MQRMLSCVLLGLHAAPLAVLIAITCLSLWLTPPDALAIPSNNNPLRVGHFPNITHAQGVIAHTLSDQGKGWFEDASKTPIEWFVYNAGPSAMEALLADSIDLAYVGPNPALNAYLRSNSLRVLAGAARGGSGLVVKQGCTLRIPADFRGKRVATPQFGNTQDVSARAWFTSQGLKVTQTGGDVLIVPTANPDQLTLFLTGDLDGVWTVEPWISRLELEAQGSLLIDEQDAITTILVASDKALTERRAEITAFVAKHQLLTEWINQHQTAAQRLLNEGLTKQTGKPMPETLISRSWPRLRFTSEVSIVEFNDFVTKAKTVGFLREGSSLDDLVLNLSAPGETP